MKGLHITADLHGVAKNRSVIAAALLIDKRYLAGTVFRAVKDAGLNVLSEDWHEFDGVDEQQGGITGMLLLAESHVAIHTWPELSAVTFDIYVCNYTQDNSAKAESVLATLLAMFKPESVEVNRIQRGELRPQ